MKKFGIPIAIMLSIFLPFNALAMGNYEPIIPMPATETQHNDRTLDYKWTWLSDNIIVRFQPGKKVNINRDGLRELYDIGLLSGRRGLNGDEVPRDTYAGQWNQAADGTWSFVFDDNTIPIDLTRIDGVLYAFNGYGELVDGYDYWNGQKTGPDGVVTCTDPEFLAYLETQYVPECTSHKAEVEAEGPGH